jgi:hypothetical protein
LPESRRLSAYQAAQPQWLREAISSQFLGLSATRGQKVGRKKKEAVPLSERRSLFPSQSARATIRSFYTFRAFSS